MANCSDCKFRIILPSSEFHCAADVNGWSYTMRLDKAVTMPISCSKKLVGDPFYSKSKLPPAKFWKLAGSLLSEQDWEHILK